MPVPPEKEDWTQSLSQAIGARQRVILRGHLEQATQLLAPIRERLDGLPIEIARPLGEEIERITQVLSGLELQAQQDPAGAARLGATCHTDAQKLSARAGKVIPGWLNFERQSLQTTEALNTLRQHPQADRLDGIVRGLTRKLADARLLAIAGDGDGAGQALAEVNTAIQAATAWADLRAAAIEQLDEVRAELHMQAGPYGGLTILGKTAAEKYPEGWQKDAKAIKALMTRREDLLRALDTPTLKSAEQDALKKDVTSLHTEAAGERVLRVTVKQEASAQAVEDCGLDEDAQKAMSKLVERWQKIRITDQPNPFGGKGGAEKLKLAGLSEEMEKMYAPGHRYLHVDGDGGAMGAKGAAAVVARERVLSRVNLEELEQSIRETEGKRVKNAVRQLIPGFKEEIVQAELTKWYRTTGAKLLAEAGFEKAAKLFEKEIFEPEDVPEEFVLQLNQAATKVQQHLLGDGFPQDRLDERIHKEEESRIGDILSRRKGKIADDGVLAEPDYWTELGRETLKVQVGRCFNCAGTAIYGLVMDEAFDALTIESVGAVSFDHHFVLVGRTGDEIGSTEPPGDDSDVLVVDIWQANQGDDPPARRWEDFTYNEETELKVFAILKPGDRKALRERCLKREK